MHTAAFSGDFTYTKAFGFKALDQDPKPAITEDAVMFVASLTKLVTSIAVLQCVERGLIKLDDDVAGYLPELAALEILTGFDPETNEPILKKRERTITLRSVTLNGVSTKDKILVEDHGIY